MATVQRAVGASVLAMAVPVFALIWFTHVLSTELGIHSGITFDRSLWMIASMLRAAALVSLFSLLAQVHRAIAGSATRARGAFLRWGGTAGLVVIALAATRELWAPRLSNSAVKYYSMTVPVATPALFLQVHRATWVSAWRHGYVVVSELALALVLALIQAMAGYKLGRARAGLSVIVGVGASIACVVLYVVSCPWLLLDFDNFHGDIFSGALAFDHISPLGNDPYTTISVCFYLAAWAASRWTLDQLEQRRDDGAVGLA